MIKRLTLISVFLIASLGSMWAQKPASKVSAVAKDSVLLDYLEGYKNQLREPAFKLYPTENIWTFLKLNTATGQIWQVQYSVNSDSPRMESVLDDDVRIYSWDDVICGRFELVPTKNMYNFILLDNIKGKCWQVQWSIDRDNRFVLPIFNL